MRGFSRSDSTVEKELLELQHAKSSQEGKPASLATMLTREDSNQDSAKDSVKVIADGPKGLLCKNN